MSTGLKANVDGSAALQVGGTDYLTVTSGGNTTFTQAANLPNTFGFKNRIINGAMVIDQRNAGAAITPSSAAYTTDRWRSDFSQASKMTFQQSSTAPAGFTNSLQVTVASAVSPGSSDAFGFFQRIEGFNTADFAWGSASATAVTLSFWVRSSVTGTYSVALVNSAGNRSYPATYTISSANTWEQKSITIPGDTSGTWLTNNGIGITLEFCLGAGSTFLGTAGSWQAANLVGATGQVSWIANAGATFYITGVQLEKGSTATSFDYRPYGTELALCQRYYYRITSGSAGNRIGMGQAYSGTNALGFTPFPVTMRVAPTALEQTGTAANYQVTNSALAAQNCSAVPTFNSADVFQANTIFTVASGLTAGNACLYVTASANIYLGWSAEL